jgi:hypothetical protein
MEYTSCLICFAASLTSFYTDSIENINKTKDITNKNAYTFSFLSKEELYYIKAEYIIKLTNSTFKRLML